MKMWGIFTHRKGSYNMDKYDVVKMVETTFKISMREPILVHGDIIRFTHISDGLEVTICLDYIVIRYQLIDLSDSHNSNIDFWLHGISEADAHKVQSFLDLTLSMIIANEERRQSLTSFRGVIHYE